MGELLCCRCCHGAAQAARDDQPPRSARSTSSGFCQGATCTAYSGSSCYQMHGLSQHRLRDDYIDCFLTSLTYRCKAVGAAWRQQPITCGKREVFWRAACKCITSGCASKRVHASSALDSAISFTFAY